MNVEHWHQEYHRFLEESLRSRQIEPRPEGEEHRVHPRFRLLSDIIWTSGAFQFSIVDLSISGISFDSNTAFEPGRMLHVRLSDLISISAEVISTAPLETTPMYLDKRLRVRCRFESDLDGMRFLVLVKDMKQLRIEA
jgi:hypothetical protein